jgi:hypothetical protein
MDALIERDVWLPGLTISTTQAPWAAPYISAVAYWSRSFRFARATRSGKVSFFLTSRVRTLPLTSPPQRRRFEDEFLEHHDTQAPTRFTNYHCKQS